MPSPLRVLFVEMVAVSHCGVVLALEVAKGFLSTLDLVPPLFFAPRWRPAATVGTAFLRNASRNRSWSPSSRGGGRSWAPGRVARGVMVMIANYVISPQISGAPLARSPLLQVPSHAPNKINLILDVRSKSFGEVNVVAHTLHRGGYSFVVTNLVDTGDALHIVVLRLKFGILCRDIGTSLSMLRCCLACPTRWRRRVACRVCFGILLRNSASASRSIRAFRSSLFAAHLQAATQKAGKLANDPFLKKNTWTVQAFYSPDSNPEVAPDLEYILPPPPLTNAAAPHSK